MTFPSESEILPSDGAIIWYINQLVEARAARYTYGLQAKARYKASVHREREDQSYIDTE